MTIKSIHITLLRACLFLGMFLFLASNTTTTQTVDTNAKMKAIFVYSFTKYIEWPQSYKDGNFIIGIVGNSSLTSELSNMAQTKKAGGTQSIEIRTFSSPASLSRCHMVIVSPDVSGNITDITAKVKNYSTLIISEKPGTAKIGAGINFTVKDNKPVFELSKGNIEKYDLKVSSSLLTLAANVY